jgi:hypothetical protein
MVATEMNKAVPTAPASCCTVAITALPCEYSDGFTESSTEVSSG